MRVIVFLTILSVFLAACAQTELDRKPPIVQTITTKQDIPIQSRPRAVNMRDVKFYIVTEDNFDEFKTKFIAQHGEFVVVAISIDDYEDLSLNMVDLKRYISQQKQLIVYYENAIN